MRPYPPFLINKFASPNQHTHTEARCQPSVLPHSPSICISRPVSAEDKYQGCGLSTRTQIKITIFYPRMAVTRTQSVPPQSMRGLMGQKRWPHGPLFAGLRTEPGLPRPHVEAAKLPQVALRTAVRLTAWKGGRNLEPEYLHASRCVALGEALSLPAPCLFS